MKILVTGAAGFIGSRLLHDLAERGDEVVGIDNINDYYDVRLKYGRLAENGFDVPAAGSADAAVGGSGADGGNAVADQKAGAAGARCSADAAVGGSGADGGNAVADQKASAAGARCSADAAVGGSGADGGNAVADQKASAVGARCSADAAVGGCGADGGNAMTGGFADGGNAVAGGSADACDAVEARGSAGAKAAEEIRSSRWEKARFVRMDLCDKEALDGLFEREKFDKVVNLAAQAGVRYSITNPYAYLQSNLVGFLNVLEACRNNGVKHLIYASSSSVYGLNAKVPYSEADKVDNPVSLYAATKKSNELMAHAYCKLYGISMTGLRFFTVYGPWGRPDMSPMLFAGAIFRGEPIKVFNGGDMIRDFTFIDDIVEGTVRCIDREPAPDANGLRYRVYNIGCSNPVRLMDFIAEIEQACGKEARKIFLPMQPGDVYQTNADTTLLEREVGYKPHVSLHEGIARFMDWYRSDKNPLR